MSVDLSLDVKKGPVFIAALLFGGLMSANMFFIKRLVDELDDTNKSYFSLQGKFAILEYRMTRLEEQLNNKEK